MLVRAWQLQVERFSIGRTSNIARSNGSERLFDVIERASSMLPEYSTIVSDSPCLINVRPSSTYALDDNNNSKFERFPNCSRR